MAVDTKEDFEAFSKRIHVLEVKEVLKTYTGRLPDLVDDFIVARNAVNNGLPALRRRIELIEYCLEKHGIMDDMYNGSNKEIFDE